MARVQLEGVSKRYPGGVVGLDLLDLTVDDGELVVFVGPSGSGKTTVLRLVAGLERPTAGRIRIQSREVTQTLPRERDVAYVPQSCPLYPHLRVFDNLLFSGRIRHGSILTRLWRRFAQPHEAANGWNAAEQSARVRQTADRLSIGHLLERWPRQLSGGERQRVALGKALLREPAAFLFDEPLASLDNALRSQLRTEIKQIHRLAGRATLYVTHDQAEALALADRMVVLERGKVQQIGTAAEVYDRPANRFVARFVGGSPPMNLLPGKIEQHDSQWFFVSDVWRWKLDPALAAQLRGAQEIELGLRAEAIEVLDHQAAADSVQAMVVSSVRNDGRREIALASPQDADRSRLLVTVVSANGNNAEGHLVGWRPRWSQAHWFDRQTGQRIDVAPAATNV